MNTLSAIESMFDWFLSATVRGSILTGCIMLIGLASRRYLPVAWKHALWIPVVIVLGMPVLLESSWQFQPITKLEMPAWIAMGESVSNASIAVVPQAGNTMSTPSMLSTMGWHQIAALVWIGGVAVYACFGIAGYVRVMHHIRLNQVTYAAELDSELLAAARDCGVGRVPHMVASKAVSSPALAGVGMGVGRSTLLVPDEFESTFSADERRAIFMHELMHLRRWDHVANVGLFILQGIHWCNPIVWFAFARLRADRELARDSDVLRLSSTEQRYAYGNALIRLLDGYHRPVSCLGFIGMIGSRSAMKLRVRAIADYERSHSAWAAPVIAIVVLLTALGGTRSYSEPAKARVSRDNSAAILVETRFLEIDPRTMPELNATQIQLPGKSESIVYVQDASQAAEFDMGLASNRGVSVLSAPKITALDGQEARISIGQQVVTKAGEPARFVGISLRLVSTIHGNAVQMKVDLSSSKMLDADSRRPINQSVAYG